jgi:hypothetical protein
MSKPAANNPNMVDLMAIGSIGNAFNAYENRKGAASMGRLRHEYLLQDIALQQQIRREQAELVAQETERQQIMAQAQGQAFQGSLDRYRAPAEMAVGDASSQIAQLYQDYMSRPARVQAMLPAATGPAAERETAMREKATADVRGEGERLAAVQGFSQFANDNSRAMASNEQLAALINNFSRGSAGASGAEVASRAGQFIRPEIVPPAKSPLADMFVGLGSLYVHGRQGPQPQYGLQPGDYELMQPGMQAPGGYGARMPNTGGDYGVRLPADLGIGGTR